MYKEFLKLLEKATGRSEHVIAINLDIRGFTPFCQSVQPLDVATYVRKVYLRIINDYFKTASYYKPTGDGLIIIIPYTDETLKEVANSAVNSCLALLENFGSLLIDDHMINFPTPQDIGIGLTRGSACCITSDNKTLDYSGRILNLASRLMDLARPSGIVFDDSFRIELLSKKTKELFSEETVYVRGVAEETPIKIYYTKKHTLISDLSKQPLREPKWNTETWKLSLGELKKVPPKELRLPLDHKPLNLDKIVVLFTYESPSIEGSESIEYPIDSDEIHLERRGSRYDVTIKLDVINKRLEEEGLSEDTNVVTIDVIYPIK